MALGMRTQADATLRYATRSLRLGYLVVAGKRLAVRDWS